MLRFLCVLLAVIGSVIGVVGQRAYKPASVLATGTWFKLSTEASGVYRLDASFLSALGVGGGLPSAQIRLFGRPGGMLPEANATPRIDDLEEISLSVVDGGDGQVSGSDYILFYSTGPDEWLPDSLNRRFTHRKNLYSTKCFYYLSVGGTGKRITTQLAAPPSTVTTTSFDERLFHELDTVNFLSSGKEWYGEELSSLPGRGLIRDFALPVSDVVSGTATLITSAAARSVNSGSRLTAFLNGGQVQQLFLPSVGTGVYDAFAREATQADQLNVTATPLQLRYSYTPGSVNSQGWLNWFEFFCRRRLQLNAGVQLTFRDWGSVGNPAVRYDIVAPSGTEVWDITAPLAPTKLIATQTTGGVFVTAEGIRLHEFVAFTNTFLTPKAEGRIVPQNLHATSDAEYLIITPAAFLPQAQRLADFHRNQSGLLPVVVTPDQIFQEFSAGSPDPTAVRDFVKLYFDRYAGTWNQRPHYLLLFGKGSFDYKSRVSNNTAFVPVYESQSSLEPLSTYTSDDFFGFLGDNEDINSSVTVNTLDIGIGRVPATTAEEAKAFVDKVMDYHSAAAFGPWRTALDFVADDEDQNLHLQDAETLTATVGSTAPVFNPQKIYLDAFQQESGSAGGRYPQANAVINSRIFNGTLLWNYSGHGGAQRLAEEVVLDQSIVNSWSNRYRLPLFVTATCDFAPYDHPFTTSLGENLITRPQTGAIALMTTTRVVFAFSNRILNNNYLAVALQPNAAGRYKSLGEAVQAAKNLTYTTSGDVVNNRKFSLLGDPAMTLAFPRLKALATASNGADLRITSDTLSATEFVTLTGEVQDNAGVLQSGFNGTVSLSLFDKVRSVTTLANDPTSQPVAFADQSNVLFRGKASAKAGKFAFRFRLPKDINFQYGAGKLSLYAQDGSRDGAGFSTNVIVGGLAAGSVVDNTGPQIRAFLNDDRFVSGGLTNASPLLLLHLSDSSGINTGSSGIDHDLIATLDGDNNRYFLLNNFYETEVDSYQKGRVRFQLPQLTPGPHTLKIKAWDVMNNSSETELAFTVLNSDVLRIDRVLNYPNPFTTQTAFWFEHNQPGVDLQVRVDIYTISGKRIKTLNQTINTPGNRSIELTWDGRDEWGERVGRGVYLYYLSVKSPTGKATGKWEKAVLFH